MKKQKSVTVDAKHLDHLEQLEEHHKEKWAFDATVNESVKALNLDVILSYEEMGQHFECIAFDKDGKLVRISAHAPVSDDEGKIEPEAITLRESVEWAADCEAAMRFGVEGGGSYMLQAKWYRMVADAMEKGGVK